MCQKPSACFAFVTIPVWKNVHKRSVCWLAVIGGAQRAEWRDSEGRDTEFSLESWKMLSLIWCFCVHLSLWWLQVSSWSPPTGRSAQPVWVPSRNRFSLSLPACPCWQVELRNQEPAWRTWEGFYICECFERVQLGSRSLHGLKPQTNGQKGLSWTGQRRWWASARRCSARSKLFSTGNLGFPRSIPKEQKCQWLIHFQ